MIQVIVEKLVFPNGTAVEIRDHIEICGGRGRVSKVQRIDESGSMVYFSRANIGDRIYGVESADILSLPFEGEGKALRRAITAESGHAAKGIVDKKWCKRCNEARFLRGQSVSTDRIGGDISRIWSAGYVGAIVHQILSYPRPTRDLDTVCGLVLYTKFNRRRLAVIYIESYLH